MAKAKTYKVLIRNKTILNTKVVEVIGMNEADVGFAIALRYIGWEILEVKEVNGEDQVQS